MIIQTSETGIHLNAEGDFYLEDGVCICCMAPEYEAPELMGFNENENHCFFKRQPQTAEELKHAIAAVASSCIRGLRYAGSDKEILAQLVDQDLVESCDVLTPKPADEAQDSGPESFVSRCWKKIRYGNK